MTRASAASPYLPASSRHRATLGAAYVTNFGALAASSPFLAVHLGASGFSAPAVAELLAVLLLVRVVAIPAWTLLADRTGAIGGVLRVVSAGALLVFVGLLLDPGPPVVAACLLVFAAFRAPFGALLDTLVLRDVRDAGGTFGAVRAWGTAGYALAALATGALVAREGSRAVLYVTTVLLAASVLSALMVRSRNAPPLRDHAPRARPPLASLLRRPRVLLVFAVALFQQIGLAPYDALFPAYLTKLAGGAAAGLAVAVGAGAEFLFLLGGAALASRLRPERLLVVACVASAARWAAIALVADAAMLVAIQALHALSFGAFFVASVTLMDREAPPSLRASAQGLFGSFAFGVAAAIGLSVAGLIERHGGLRAVFALASVASLVAALCASFLRGDEATSARV